MADIQNTNIKPSQPVKDKISLLQAHHDCVSACILCYDDSVIVTASHDATIVLWVGSLHALAIPVLLGRPMYRMTIGYTRWEQARRVGWSCR